MLKLRFGFVLLLAVSAAWADVAIPLDTPIWLGNQLVSRLVWDEQFARHISDLQIHGDQRPSGLHHCQLPVEQCGAYTVVRRPDCVIVVRNTYHEGQDYDAYLYVGKPTKKPEIQRLWRHTFFAGSTTLVQLQQRVRVELRGAVQVFAAGRGHYRLTAPGMVLWVQVEGDGNAHMRTMYPRVVAPLAVNCQQALSVIRELASVSSHNAKGTDAAHICKKRQKAPEAVSDQAVEAVDPVAENLEHAQTFLRGIRASMVPRDIIKIARENRVDINEYYPEGDGITWLQAAVMLDLRDAVLTLYRSGLCRDHMALLLELAVRLGCADAFSALRQLRTSVEFEQFSAALYRLLNDESDELFDSVLGMISAHIDSYHELNCVLPILRTSLRENNNGIVELLLEPCNAACEHIYKHTLLQHELMELQRGNQELDQPAVSALIQQIRRCGRQEALLDRCGVSCQRSALELACVFGLRDVADEICFQSRDQDGCSAPACEQAPESQPIAVACTTQSKEMPAVVDSSAATGKSPLIDDEVSRAVKEAFEAYNNIIKKQIEEDEALARNMQKEEEEVEQARLKQEQDDAEYAKKLDQELRKQARLEKKGRRVMVEQHDVVAAAGPAEVAADDHNEPDLNTAQPAEIEDDRGKGPALSVSALSAHAAPLAGPAKAPDCAGAGGAGPAEPTDWLNWRESALQALFGIQENSTNQLQEQVTNLIGDIFERGEPAMDELKVRYEKIMNAVLDPKQARLECGAQKKPASQVSAGAKRRNKRRNKRVNTSAQAGPAEPKEQMPASDDVPVGWQEDWEQWCKDTITELQAFQSLLELSSWRKECVYLTTKISDVYISDVTRRADLVKRYEKCKREISEFARKIGLGI